LHFVEKMPVDGDALDATGFAGISTFRHLQFPFGAEFATASTTSF
jgi:hypothetical protein